MFYLESNDWDYNSAIEQHKSDMDWERNNVEGSVPHSKRRTTRSPSAAAPGNGGYKIITGTSGMDYFVNDDGTIEMINNASMNESLLKA
mmetsp:Transcript_2603/g.3875  ORF Transcript_2603/g.3875 Transcript_2603/m.3875 type:complete len:89 (-) Transcript_2603:43-309(-)